MGTMIQRRKLDEADFRGDRFRNHRHDLKGNGDVLALTRPDVIGDIHREYLAAGADILETNTFSSTAIAQADYGLESLAYELNLEGTRVAKAAADEWSARTPDRPRFVAGAMGPTNRTLSISPEVDNPAARAVTFDQVREAYRDQVRGLIDGGADLLLLETIFDTLNAKAAIAAVLEIFEERGVELPLMLSATITDRSGRTLSGQMLDAFYASIRHAKPFSVGLNCALGAEQMRPYLAELARIAECYVSSYPNAGLPNAFGEYDEQPADTARLLRDFAESGFVNILGGCCGTTPDHIRAVDEAMKGIPPRERPEPLDQSERFTQFSGLETLTLRPDSNFTMVGERTNVTGSKRFARLVTSGQFGEAADVALGQVRGGANILDVNMDEGMLDSEAAMTTFLNVIATEPEIARLPIMIDSSKWSVLEAGIEVRAGQGDCELDQLEGGRRGLPAQGPPRTAVRRRRGRDGLRRARAGRHDRAEGRNLPACLSSAAGQGGIRPLRHHFRPEHPGDRHGARRAQRLRRQFHRGDTTHQGDLSGREDQRRGQQPVVLIPRQRRRAERPSTRRFSITPSGRASTWVS